MSLPKLKIPADPLSSNIFAGVILAGVGGIASLAYAQLFDQISRFNFGGLCASLVLFVSGAFVLISTSKAHGRPLKEALFIISGIVLGSIGLVLLLDSQFALPKPQSVPAESKADSQRTTANAVTSLAPTSSARPDAGGILVLLFPSGAILFALLWQAGALASLRVKDKQVRHNFGFAATGVLAIHSTEGTGNFLLVLNKNLRNRQGLWVPPGGHVDIFSEQPEIRVVEKVKLETGFDAKIIEVHTSLLPPTGARRTDSCTWYTPPAFFLREDLQGLCSKVHGVHLDFVYILIATTQQTGREIKYGHTDRILVPIADCTVSHDATKAAVARAIDSWRTNQGLNPAAMLDNCTADVTMRLHLAAHHLIQTGSIK